jgi:DNA-directed RNA polymerase specialized sigma24 family protein
MLALQGNPRGDPDLHARLSRRTLAGHYEVSESELVLTIRACQRAGDSVSRTLLCEVLLERCAPEFERHSCGLRHRPDLREEAIAGMREHVLREAQDPKELFIVQNFIHYLRCACVDEFNRVLHDEGLRYRRDEGGRPLGTRVPHSLVEPLLNKTDDGEDVCVGVFDQEDQYAHLHAWAEARRILGCLPDLRDRCIVALRVLEERTWKEIAAFLYLNERTVRLRYSRALETIRARLSDDLPDVEQVLALPVQPMQIPSAHARLKAAEMAVLCATGQQLDQALSMLAPIDRQLLIMRLRERRKWSEISALAKKDERGLCRRYARALGTVQDVLRTMGD